MPELLSRHVKLRRAVDIKVEAHLGRALVAQGGEPAGLPARLGRKFLKNLFFLVHQSLGVPAPGWASLGNGRRFRINCANTAYLQYRRDTLGSGCYEPEVTAMLDLLGPGLGSVYYVGANWGYFALLLGSHPGFRGHIQAFEINPASYRELRRAMMAGGLDGAVTCHPFGLSDRDGSVRLSRGRHSVLARILEDGEAGRAENAQVRRLDGLGMSPPDLIKLDVEGHEAQVLEGALDTLRRASPHIVLESWQVVGDPQPVLEPLLLLEREGYSLYRLGMTDDRLDATPLAAADRPGIAEALNLLAVPARRRAALEAAFRA